MTCALIIAAARSRCRGGTGSISSSSPSWRAVPSTTATCPRGRLRVIPNVPSAAAAAAGWPFEHPCQDIDLRRGPGGQVAAQRVAHRRGLAPQLGIFPQGTAPAWVSCGL
jgi:hypothetical protein